MRRVLLVLLGIMVIGAPIFAHDEGHGPKINDAGKYGGLVAPVVDVKDAALGAKATLIYKAELVRASDGTVRVYLYDVAMKPLSPSLWKSARGELHAKVKGKYQTVNFDLTAQDKAFLGKAPKSPAKPFDLDFRLQEESRTLLMAFDNLD